jgi:aldehyde dehydrogenase (NAD+)
MQKGDQLYINGQWAASTGRKMIDVHSASTEEVIGRVPEGTPADVDAAAGAARAAFEGRAGLEEYLEYKAIRLKTEARP